MNDAGGATMAELMGKKDRMFLGDPVEFVQVMPKTASNSQICALYGDLRQAGTLGTRRQFQLQESRDYKFAERQITYLGTARSAISVEDLGTAEAAGPLVGLITAAG